MRIFVLEKMRFSIKTAPPIIDRWTILHLPRRKDRMPLALSNAERLGVPRDIVGFWDAKDADDFESTEAIIASAVADGFEAFENVDPNARFPGRICQTWNVCRFLRDLANRDVVEMFIHDGMLMSYVDIAPLGFFPDFQWFCECVEACQAQSAPFQLLVIGDIHAHFPIAPIACGSCIFRGIGHESNSVRIYSSLGAKSVLKRIQHRLHRGVYEADIMFREDEVDGEKFESYWSPPGSYTLLYQQLAMDMPADYLGSNTVDWKAHTGQYENLFERWQK